MNSVIIHNFTDDLKIKFIASFGDYYAYVESKGNNHKIPLLLTFEEVLMAVDNIADIKNFDFPTDYFCQVITGYLSFIMKYKYPNKRYIEEQSLFRDPN